MTARPDKASPQAVCEACGKGDINVVVMPATYSKDGVTVSYADEYSICSDCGEEFYTKAQSAANSRAITAAIRQAKDLPTGEEVRDARINKLHMTLPEFEQALCVGPNTVGRWERGTVAPSGVATGMLWLAINRPNVFLEFARSRGVIPKRLAPNATLTAESSQGPSTPNTKPTLTVSRGGTFMIKTTTHGRNTPIAPDMESIA
jgi:putative zinc finger/helix-turn-helix YgiT family protein